MAHVQTGSALSPEDRELIGKLPDRISLLRDRLRKKVIGQEETVEQLLISFVAGGHALIVGVPGLAKTLMIRSLAELFDLDFARIQFTPDLMPSDITGTTLLARNEATGQREFRFQRGPIFAHLLLADEINRTPPKTQAALLEAMEEHQVTVGGKPQPLDPPFFVLATQNPIEQEGTYTLPVTQLDRFLFQIDIGYPDDQTEFDIVATTTAVDDAPLEAVLGGDEVRQMLTIPARINVPDRLVARATKLVRATRPDENASTSAKEWILWGAGPRAVQSILGAARARAVIAGRTEVDDSDYEEVLLPALRHRVQLNYHAEAEGVHPDQVIALIRHEIGDGASAPGTGKESAPARGAKALWGKWIEKWGDPAPRFR
ncbi:MAG: AAA family ATPase [Planctomycetota bacterium]